MSPDEEDASLVMSEPPDLLRARKKLKVLDEECVLAVKLLLVLAGSIGLCLYCVFYCSHYLLVIMIASACCCTTYPVMALPFMLSLLLYVFSHQRALAQAFTLAEDVYAFQDTVSNAQ